MLNLKNYLLFTKDGRDIGNAIISFIDDANGCYNIITDYGNRVDVYEYDLLNKFHLGPLAPPDHIHFTTDISFPHITD